MDEQRIIEGIRHGDRDALAALFRVHYEVLVRFADSYMGDTDLAEEVVCEVFASLMDVGEAWRIRTTVRGYLFGAVRRRLLMQARTAHRERGRYAALLADEDVSLVGPTVSTAEEQLIAQEESDRRHAALRQALATLSPRSRLVLSLRIAQGLAFDEIAEIMETTPAAVQMQLSRALKALRTILPEYLSPP